MALKRLVILGTVTILVWFVAISIIALMAQPVVGAHTPLGDKYVEAPVLGVSTADGNAWLSGKSSPPANLKADIIKRLQQAKSGHCPTK